MNLFQKQQKTSGYKTIPDARAADEETAAVLFGTIIRSPSTMTMTTDHRSPKWIMVTSVLGMMMMLVVTGGLVWMLQTTDGGLTTTAVERNRYNVGFSCCKKQSSNECFFNHDPMTAGCRAKNGYDGTCHKGMVGTTCCTDKDQGTYYVSPLSVHHCF